MGAHIGAHPEFCKDVRLDSRIPSQGIWEIAQVDLRDPRGGCLRAEGALWRTEELSGGATLKLHGGERLRALEVGQQSESLGMEGVKIPLDLVKMLRLWVVVVCEREEEERKKASFNPGICGCLGGKSG